jgi:hypothetical protein
MYSTKTTFVTKLCNNKKYNYRKQIRNSKPLFNNECQLARTNLRKRKRKFKKIMEHLQTMKK